MINKAIISLKKINFKLFLALLVLGLSPAIYTTVRVFFLGQLPGDYSYSIAGQLSWINLLYEILNEAIILPLFYFVGKVVNNKSEFTNRIKTGLLMTFGIYIFFSLAIIIGTEPLLSFMATDTSIFNESATYIRIESIANIFSILSSFALVALVTLNKAKYVYILTAAKLFLCLIFDTFFISTLGLSLNLGVNGIGYSNIAVNLILFIVTIFLITKEGIRVFSKTKLDFKWVREFLKVGSISGLESFVRNIAYMLMISRMVNVVNEEGVYWVANNFIWGWLLLPVTQLAELIKQETARDKKAVGENSLGYFTLTGVICLTWLATIPLWKPFMSNVLQYSDVDKLFGLVIILVGFYALYAFQNVFDATFYGLGKTNYMLFESIVTNSIYYGIAFILYLQGIWVPTLTSIALLFGIGMAFDSIVSLSAYIFLRKRMTIMMGF